MRTAIRCQSRAARSMMFMMRVALPIRSDFPFYVLNLEREFEESVVEPFIQSYLKRRDADSVCRLQLAFEICIARPHGSRRLVATRSQRVITRALNMTNPRIAIVFFAAGIIAKDQSYFLWELTQDQLSRAYFPLGEMYKEEVRDIARDANLYTANKPESQEICFVPDGKYSEFIDRYLDHEGRIR